MPENQESNSPRSWTNLSISKGEIVGVLIYLVLAVFAYLTPLDVLDQYPQAREFSDFMASWNLQIRRVGEISGSANQANRFVYSVLWCVMPACWVYLVIHLYRHYRTKDGKRKTTQVTSELSGFLEWLFTLVMLYGLLTLPTLGELPRIGTAMFINSVTRSLFAPCLVFLVGALVSHFILMPILAYNRRIVIRKNKQKR